MSKIEERKISEMRKQAVIEAFFDTLTRMRKDNPNISLGEVIKEAVKSSAPRLYVSFENTRRFISLLARKKRLPIKNSNRVAMYKEIYHRYIKRVKDSSKRYKYIILEQIIEEPAPSFYLDEETFRGIVYKTLRAH